MSKLLIPEILTGHFYGNSQDKIKNPTIMWGKAKRHAAHFENAADILHSRNLKPLTLHYTYANKDVGCDIYRRFSNLDKCQPEAAGDVISDRFVGPMVLDSNY